ncbi:MAG: hypothetical protein F4123_05415 [Gemmatimonadetes bacterium]|nr:hypothetical protein [Gemmatimonadota bacterium]MYB99366.1 hypothetical protein [Gemmatimonadota bacterium]MYI45803.1 hypothetical protein [Gemmatimonadota bacterium]
MNNARDLPWARGVGGGLARCSFRRVAAPALLLAVVAAGSGSVNRAGAQWVEEPGNVWMALAMYHQDTRERFGAGGDVEALLAEGHAVATSSFLTTALGIADGVDMWSQLSFHRLRYDDAAADRSSAGLGNLKLWLRAAPLRWLGSSVPFAVRAGLKVPLGDFEDVAADEIPLGDGQRDWEVLAELGHSFWPRSVYVSGWVGYRWREENTESMRDFGNELFYYAQIGGQLGRVGYKLAVDGWNGAASGADGVSGPGFERDLVQVLPTLLYDVGVGQVEAGVRFALGGRNVTAGRSFVLKYFKKWERSR